MAISREEISNSKIEQLLAPAEIAASKDDIMAVDTSGFESVLFNILVGNSAVTPDAVNHMQIKLKHSDDNASFEDCEAKEVVGLGGVKIASKIIANINAASAINKGFMAAYIGARRYVKPVITVAGNLGDGIQLAIAAILQNPKYRPVVLQAPDAVQPMPPQNPVGQNAEGVEQPVVVELPAKI